MKLGELLRGEQFKASSEDLLDRKIVHWTDFSSEVNPQSWFIAVSGETLDGHRFIPEAIQKGAQGLIVDERQVSSGLGHPHILVPDTRKILSLISSRWYGEPSKRLHLIGITGTNGKTTTAFLIQHLLKQFSHSGLIGTVEARWKAKRLSAINTTPGPRALNAILDEMVRDGVTACAMEVSSHALKQERVSQIHFASAVFTNLTQDHLDYHKTFEDYFESKVKLFQNFPSVTRRVINLDDGYGVKLMERIPRDSAVTYAVNQHADYRAADIRLGLEKTEFTLHVHVIGKKYRVKSRLICLHNVYNLLAAIAVCAEMRYPIEEMLHAAEQFAGVSGRLERFEHPKGAIVFVDYAHSPDAFLNVFQSLAPLKKGRLISVFGCGGNRDRDKRPKMGRIAREFSDRMIVTQDNPREEHPKEIIGDILMGIQPGGMSQSVDVIEDRREAIREALSMAREQDIVLILGKGHEDYQIIGKEKRKFSDQEEIREWLKQQSLTHPSKSLLGV